MTTGPNSVALLVMTDGRECIERAVPAFLDAFDRPDLISELWIHDDSGDPAFGLWLTDRFEPIGFRVHLTGSRSGFGGAIRSAWDLLRRESSARFVFHLEDDFVPKRTVPVSQMIMILDENPDLVNLALRRQPWNDRESLAGGIVEQHPEAYVDRRRWLGEDEGGPGVVEWLEHRLFFTTNPGLYRRSLIESADWPTGLRSEGRFSLDLLTDDRIRFGYFGSRDSGEAVEHIGHERVGIGY